MSVVTRVRQLIALTASDSENEARNAAMQACKLIREHGFEVVERGGGASGSPDLDTLREIFAAAGERQESRTRVEQRMRDHFDEMRAQGVRGLSGSIIPVIGVQFCFICGERLSGSAYYMPALHEWAHPKCAGQPRL